MDNKDRRYDFQRNIDLENLLTSLNQILEPAEKSVISEYVRPKYPVVMIVGCGRSGTTLLLQWLANTGFFAYPTNLLSRFYAAPYIGAQIQRLLTDPKFSFRNELDELNATVGYASDLGKTSGVLSPNEFWYFWRRFFKYGDIQELNKHQLSEIDSKSFVSELAAIEAVFSKPLALKALIVNFNIHYIARILEKVIFIHTVRDSYYNAQSLLESRNNFFGSIDSWYSFKPAEYQFLKDINPYAQVAGQVYFTNLRIENDLRKIDRNKWIKVTYESFCKNPGKIFRKIKNKFIDQGIDIDWKYSGPLSFECNNTIRLDNSNAQKILNAFKDFREKGD